MSHEQKLKLAYRAGFIKQTLGTRRAAGFLRNRAVCLEDALALLGFPPRTWP